MKTIILFQTDMLNIIFYDFSNKLSYFIYAQIMAHKWLYNVQINIVIFSKISNILYH